MKYVRRIVSVLLIILVLIFYIALGMLSTKRLDQYMVTVPNKNLKLDLLGIPIINKDLDEIDKEFKQAIYPTEHAWEVARSIEGTKGDCYRIVKLFIKNYFDTTLDVDNLEKTEYNNLKPGDIVYYRNGGLGIEHWAVWLGNDWVLHGNYNGRAVIASVWLDKSTYPIFYHLKINDQEDE